MEILLERKIKDTLTSIGDLSIDGVYECHTLEDTDRGLTQAMPPTDIAKIKVQNLI